MHPIYPIPSVFFKPEAIWFSGISYVPLAVLSVGGTICVVILEEEHDYIQQFHYAKYDLDTIHAWNTNFSPTNETGSFSLLNLGQFFPVHLRQIALYLWCSFTMAVNLIVFFVDETNYKEEERKEILKEEKRKVSAVRLSAFSSFHILGVLPRSEKRNDESEKNGMRMNMNMRRHFREELEL